MEIRYEAAAVREDLVAAQQRYWRRLARARYELEPEPSGSPSPRETRHARGPVRTAAA